MKTYKSSQECQDTEKEEKEDKQILPQISINEGNESKSERSYEIIEFKGMTFSLNLFS